MEKKRTTIYFDPGLHRALRLRAAETGESLSEIVEEALREHLREDIEDLEAVRDRVGEPRISYEALLRQMKDSGEL